jgi:hypothetical protein
MTEINYDTFLDEWTEKCYKEMDGCTEKIECLPVGSHRERYLSGYIDGILMAMAFLSVKEKNLKAKLEKEGK